MTSTTTVNLLRHGEVQGGPYFRGQVDDALTDKGWQQMQAAVTGSPGWDVIVSSDLQRCRHFAEQLALQHEQPVTLEKRFREISFGQWQGKTAAQLMASCPDELRRFWKNPASFTPPGAESIDLFRQRVWQGWQSMLSSQQGKRILLITHSGVMGIILAEILAIPVSHLLRLDISHATLLQVVIDHHDQQSYPRVIFS